MFTRDDDARVKVQVRVAALSRGGIGDFGKQATITLRATSAEVPVVVRNDAEVRAP